MAKIGTQTREWGDSRPARAPPLTCGSSDGPEAGLVAATVGTRTREGGDSRPTWAPPLTCCSSNLVPSPRMSGFVSWHGSRDGAGDLWADPLPLRRRTGRRAVEKRGFWRSGAVDLVADPHPLEANEQWPSGGAASPGLPRPRGCWSPGVRSRMVGYRIKVRVNGLCVFVTEGTSSVTV